MLQLSSTLFIAGKNPEFTLHVNPGELGRYVEAIKLEVSLSLSHLYRL